MLPIFPGLRPFIPVALLASANVAAVDLDQLLECRNADVLRAPLADVIAQARETGFNCRMHERSRESSANCTGGRGRAFGRTVTDFTLAERADGGRVLSVAFTEPPARLRPLLQRAQAEDGPDALVASALVDQREDGVAELRCALAGRGGEVGAIAGTVEFRGMQPVPPMRVCAAPLRDPARPVCVQTESGGTRYRIDDLPPGEYYLTAYPTRDNPQRLINALTTPLARCPTGPGECPEQLQSITVHPGETRAGIDPRTLLPQLPPPLRPASMDDR